jgi:hypothetical protein
MAKKFPMSPHIPSEFAGNAIAIALPIRWPVATAPAALTTHWAMTAINFGAWGFDLIATDRSEAKGGKRWVGSPRFADA